jgi:peptide/nickel transport system substrate-binding protein
MAELTRRTMLGGLAGGLALSAGGLLVPQHSLAQTPKRGGRIRVASIASSTADTLDPAKGALSTDYARHYMFYSGLTQYDGALRAQPALAESFESDDRTLWTIKLRKGVEFHDGSSLTADDVVYSLARHNDPVVASKMKTIAEQFAEVKAVGPLEVQLRLTSANADLPVILAASHFVIVKNGTTDFRHANGTGPYRLKVFNPGVRTVGTRFENYWKPGKPYLDEIELIGIPDEVSRVNALLSGDVHLINAINPRSTRRIRASGTHQVLETPSGLYTDLIMRQDALPTGNPHFVMAMKYLLHRELIKKALFRGFATIANDQPIPPSNPYFNAELPQRPFDLDRAKWHLRQGGLEGVRLPIWASAAADSSVDMASVLQEMGAQAGIRIGVSRVPADGYWSNHWMKHPLGFGNSNPRPTADLMFSLFYKSDAPWNESGWNNPRFDRLILEARGEADEARRKAMYGELQAMAHHGAGIGIPVFISLIDGYDRRLGGLGSIPSGGLMGYLFADNVWWNG